MKNTTNEVFEKSAPLPTQKRIAEIFKTDVQHPLQAQPIVQLLQNRFPKCRINFDLNDCDNILRIEGDECEVDVETVLHLVKARNHFVEWIE